MLCHECGQHQPETDSATRSQWIIESPAMPKARPNFDGRNKRAFMPDKYTDWAQAFKDEAAARGMRPTEGGLSVAVGLMKDRTLIRVSQYQNRTTRRTGVLTGDVDNYLGGVMDALQGVGWKNDRQILDGRGYLLREGEGQ